MKDDLFGAIDTDQMFSELNTIAEARNLPKTLPFAYAPAFEPTEIPKYPKDWTDQEEGDFKEWYKGWAIEAGIDQNPDDPRHKYDYRSAYRANAFPKISPEDGRLHWDSRFKHPDHPNRFVNGVDTMTGQPDPALLSSVGSIADWVGRKASALGRGAAAGIVTGLPQMAAEASEFLYRQFARLAPETGTMLADASKNVADFFAEKEKEWFSPEEGDALDRMIYQAGNMLGPSILPAGIARTGLGLVFGIGKKAMEARKLFQAGKIGEFIEAKAAADKAAKLATNLASATGATFFGLSQAGSTMSRALDKAKELEAQGQFDEAKKMRDTAYGIAPIATGVIEGIGEYLGTKYLAKLFRLDEAVALRRGGRELVKDFIKTLGVEVSTEIGQSAGEAAVEVGAGITPERSQSELLKMFGVQDEVSTVLASALDVIGPTAFMTAITGGFGAAHNLMLPKIKEKLKPGKEVTEEEVLPRPETVLTAMGAISKTGIPETEAPTTEAPAAEAAAPPPELTRFENLIEAEEAGVNATPEQVAQWEKEREEYKNQAKEVFIPTGQHKAAADANFQFQRLGRAIEAAKNPEKFAAPAEETKAAPSLEVETTEGPKAPVGKVGKRFETGLASMSDAELSGLGKITDPVALNHVLSESIARLPSGTYLLNTPGKAAPSLREAVSKMLGYDVDAKALERTVRGLATTNPDAIKASLTLGLEEVRLLETGVESPKAPGKAAPLLADMNGMIVEQEQKTGKSFDFRSSEDRAWLKSLGYTEQDIKEFEGVARMEALNKRRKGTLRQPEEVIEAVKTGKAKEIVKKAERKEAMEQEAFKRAKEEAAERRAKKPVQSIEEARAAKETVDKERRESPDVAKQFQKEEPKGAVSGSPNPEVAQRASETYGVTEDPREAGFILPDGRMVDLSGKKQKHEFYSPGTRSLDHRVVADLYPGEYPSSKKLGLDNHHVFSFALDRFQKETGAIRVATRTDRSGGVVEVNLSFSEGQKISVGQLRSLAKIQKESGNKAKFIYEVTRPDKKRGMVTIFSGETRLLNTVALANEGAKPRLEYHGSYGPVFYNKVHATLEAKLPGKATPAKLNELLKTWVDKGEFSQDALDWSGLNEWLERYEPDDRISKDDVLQFLRMNEVVIKEVVRGRTTTPPPLFWEQTIDDDTWIAIYIFEDGSDHNEYMIEKSNGRYFVSSRGAEGSYKGRDGSPTLEEAKALAQRVFAYDFARQDRPLAKYNRSPLVLPGGEEYREMLFQIAPRTKYSDELIAARQKVFAKYEAALNDLDHKLTQALREGSAEQREQLIVERNQLEDKRDSEADALIIDRFGGTYYGAHWEEANILAHVRFNTRTGPNGEKILFIEEIQSDWHAAGRKGGYVSKEKLAAAQKKYDTARAAYDDFINNARMKLRDMFRKEAPTMSEDKIVNMESRFNHLEVVNVLGKEEAERYHELTNQLYTAEMEREAEHQDRIPNAPFQKTWYEYVLKRMIRYAAENGYNKVGFTTGEQQQERYKLSRVVETVDYISKDGDTYAIVAVSKATGEAIKLRGYASADDDSGALLLSKEQVLEVFGKELGQKIIDSPEGTLFEGLDLDIGSKKLLRFYEETVPWFLQKYIKKWGSKLEDLNLGPKKLYRVRNRGRSGTLQWEYETYNLETGADRTIYTSESQKDARDKAVEAVQKLNKQPVLKVDFMGDTSFSEPENPTFRFSIVNEAGDEIKKFSGKDFKEVFRDANNALVEMVNNAIGEPVIVHSFPVTDKMKESVLNTPQAEPMLGSVHAFGAPASNLARAMEMVGKYTIKQIWRETGWVMGPEGLWRFEIDDRKMKLKDPGPGKETKTPAGKRGWRWHATLPATKEITETMTDQEILDELALRTSWTSSVKLSDIIEHPELFKYYPQLKDVVVVVDPSLPAGGSYEPTLNLISISPAQFMDQADLEQTIIHEVQHAIQELEGFSVGTSVELEFKLLREDPKNAKKTDLELAEQALKNYEMNAAENESIDGQARFLYSSDEKKKISPYTYSIEQNGPMDKWILRSKSGTAFQIDTNQAKTKNMLEMAAGAARNNKVADIVRQVLKETGLDQFPDVVEKIQLALLPYDLKVDPKEIRESSILEYMKMYNASRERVLNALRNGKVLGLTSFLDPIHSLIRVSLRVHKDGTALRKTLDHETWHVIKMWFLSDKQRDQIDKLIPSEEQQAEDWVKYLTKIADRKVPEWLSKIYDSLIMLFKTLRARLLGMEFTDADMLFDWMRHGQIKPVEFRATEKFLSLTGATLTKEMVSDVKDMQTGQPVKWVVTPLTTSSKVDSPEEGKKKVKVMVDSWMRPAQMSLDDSGWTPPKTQADVGSEDRDIPKIIELPEILEIYKALMGGKIPGVRKLLFGDPGTRGVFMPGRGTVRLRAANFRDPVLAARVLSHEIGHVIDWLPDFMMGGNILGKIASIKNWVEKTLPFKPGDQGEITDADKARLREEAIKLLGVVQELRTKWIDKTLTEEVKISPEDVLKIWNAVENSRLLNPELYKYIAGLDTDAKKLIIKAALKGNLTPEIENFVKTVKVGPTLKQQVTEVVYKQPSQEAILKKLAELIEKEIRTRKLWVEQEVRDELMTLSARWRPWDPEQGSAYYNKVYRPSANELYADAISALFNDPQFLKAQAPRFYEAFFNYLEAKPEFKKIYMEIQRQIHSGEVRSNRVERFYNAVDHGNEVYGQQYEFEKLSFKDDALRAVFDAFHFILRDVRKVGEENIPAHLNPRYKLEEMVYTPSEIEGMLTLLYHNVIQPIEKAGLKWDREFALMKFLMRVAFDPTISGQAHPGGWDKNMAIEQLQFMKDQQLTDKQWEALKEASKAFRKIHEEFFIDKAEANEVYDDEMIKRFRNNEDYVTWDVMPYLEARYGRAVATRIFAPIGTLQDIPNPATATIMKDIAFIKAVNRNVAMKAVVKFYQDYAKILGIDVQEAPKVYVNGHQQIQEPPVGSNLGLITYLHKGKAYGVWLPKEIAESVQSNPIKHTFTARVLRGLTNPMRQIFTNLNYGFWIVNAFFRDAQRLVMALPGWRVDKFAKAWLSGIKPAFKSVFAIPDDVVLEMQKNNALISVTDMHDLTSEDEQIERLLKAYGVKGPKFYNERVMKPWGHLFNYIGNRLRLGQFYFEATGRALERTTKVAAYKYLTENFPDMPKEVITHMVRSRGGSPDFWRSGREHTLLNNFLMFINAQKEGYRGDFEAFKDNPGEFAAKKFVFTVAPKLLMFAGILGLLGPAVKDIFDGVSEYDLTNYLVIPVGKSASGRSVYWRVPTDELSRLVGGVLWKAVRTLPIPTTSGRDESIALGEGVTHLIDYAAGQVPTLSPLIGVLLDTVEYAAGQNPYDTFYGRHAIGDLEFMAKDARAREQFVKYVFEKMGGSIVYKFKHDKIEKIAEELESILGFPVSSKIGDFMLKAPDQPVVSNVLGRFLKVSNYGEREKLLKLKDKVKTENARVILDAREGAYALVDGRQLTNEQVLAIAQKPDVLSRQQMLSLARKYGMVYFEEWLSAGTTKEKMVILQAMMEKNALKNQESNVSAPPYEPRRPAPKPSGATPGGLPPLSVLEQMQKETFR